MNPFPRYAPRVPTPPQVKQWEKEDRAHTEALKQQAAIVRQHADIARRLQEQESSCWRASTLHGAQSAQALIAQQSMTGLKALRGFAPSPYTPNPRTMFKAYTQSTDDGQKKVAAASDAI